jgi:sugar lactone lactonase YvrE
MESFRPSRRNNSLLRGKLLIASGLGVLCFGGTLAQAQSNYEPYAIMTFAGNSPPARFGAPSGVAVDSAGNVYVADTSNQTIRKITYLGELVSTLAGLAGSFGSVDGTGHDARFNSPQGTAVDAAGNTYVTDTSNHTIRKITPSGVVSTLAGLSGSSGSKDGTGSDARFNSPQGVAVDSAGNVYVADTFNNSIRKVTPEGAVSTLAGLAGSFGSADGPGSTARFYYPIGIAVDSTANIYVGDTNNNLIRKITPAGIVSTLAGSAASSGSVDGTGNAARFYSPRGVAVDSAGNVYVVDNGNHTIRKISPDAAVSTLAGRAGFSGSVDGAVSDARFNSPQGVAVDAAGNISVADYGNSTIRRITPDGIVSTLAGLAGVHGSTDGAGIPAGFSYPEGVAVDPGGNVYVADYGNSVVRKITPAGLVSTLAGLIGARGSADGQGSAARFNGPSRVAVDTAGSVYVCDSLNNTIRKVSPAGVVSTLVGVDGMGNATHFNGPNGVALDSVGNIYVADNGNQTIRKMAPDGLVSTLAGSMGVSGSADGTGSAARFNSPSGVAVDSAGNVYVGDAFNQTIRKITPAGVVSTLAGRAGVSGSADGPANTARFNAPQGVAVDTAGNVYVADTFNNSIRKVTPAGIVTTLAGVPGSAGVADGTGSAARFGNPFSVALDSTGIVYVADYNNTIRAGRPSGTTLPPPPVIRSPLVEADTIGQPFVYQFETTGATSLAVYNLPLGLTFNASLAAITGKPVAAGTFQVGLSASNASGTTTATLTITVQPIPASGPVITSSNGATGKVGQSFSFQVTTTGGTSSLRLSAAGLPPGLGVDVVTGVISGTPSAVGSSAVTLIATDGNLSTTSTLQLTITSDPVLPIIVSANTALLTPGQPFSYTIKALGGLNPSDPTGYSLVFDLPNGLFFDAQSGIISGTFTGAAPFGASAPTRPDLSGGIVSNVQLFATNSHGTSTLPLIFFLAPTGAVNIATRISVGTGDNVLIAGFIITGNAPKKVVIRAIAPSLNVNGVPLPGAMRDPILELHQPAGLLGTNDNWRDTQENEIISTGIPPTDERESAILAYLNPGNFTAVVRGKDNATGIAVVEVYDLGTASLDSSSNAKLAQISTRGTVLGGDNVMIGGFIITQVATKVIVRAIGPSLSAFGVGNPLQDPTLELHDSSGSTIVSNDDWRTTQEQQIIDTTVPPKDGRESAIVATLSPGAYTAIVRGKGDKTGVALVEVYGLQ